MSKSYKFIIPLLHKDITLEDLSLNSGFVGAFYYDINRPYLTNHIFLLYLNTIATQEAYNRYHKFKNLDTLYKTYHVQILGKDMLLYAFCITNQSINLIKRNLLLFSDEDKLRLMSFWRNSDEDINKYFVSNDYSLSFEFDKSVVPEEDYRPSCKLMYDKKGQVLQYRSTCP